MPPPFDMLLFDLDGTVCLSGAPIGGVVSKLNRLLQRQNVAGVLVTNNSSKPRAAYEAALETLGIDTRCVTVITPVEVAADYLVRRGLQRPFILGTAACVLEFESHGLRHEDDEPDCVVVAFDTELTYSKLDRCCEVIRRGAPVLQTNIDMFCPTVRGPVPDCGAIQALLTKTTGVRPSTHFGKPGAVMARYLRRRLGLSKRQLAVVGDRQATDVMLGNRLGATTVWVRSGDPTIAPQAQPDLVYQTMEAFLDDCC